MKVFAIVAAAALSLCGSAAALAQYPYVVPPYVAPPTAYGYGVAIHADGQGVTEARGNEQMVWRTNGSATYYARQGDWEQRVTNRGSVGYVYYDDVQQVQRFDYRDLRTGRRKIGENPYPGNPYSPAWTRTGYGW